jgi:hypothetical protein
VVALPGATAHFFYHAAVMTRQLKSYNARMTLVEVTYQLQVPLRPEQLRALGRLANLYGLRRFRVDQERNQISLEYDGSRLKEIQLADALRGIKIPVSLRV